MLRNIFPPLMLVFLCYFLLINLNAQSQVTDDIFIKYYDQLPTDSVTGKVKTISIKYLNAIKKRINKSSDLINMVFIRNLIFLKEQFLKNELISKITDIQIDILSFVHEGLYNENISNIIKSSNKINSKTVDYYFNNKPSRYYYNTLLPEIITKASKKILKQLRNEFLEKKNMLKPPSIEIWEDAWALGKALAKTGDPEAIQFVIEALERSKSSSSRAKIIKQVGMLNVRELTNYLIETVMMKDFSEESYRNHQSDMAAVLSIIYENIYEFRNAPPDAFKNGFSLESFNSWFQKHKSTYRFIEKQ